MLPGFQLFPAQASTLAPEIDNLYLGIVAITAFFALIVVVFVVYFAFKYRDDTGDKIRRARSPDRCRSSWVVADPVLHLDRHLRLGVDRASSTSSRAPDQTLEIYSTGKRWMWRFQHIDGQREINELHVPARPARSRRLHLGGRAPRPLHPGVPGQGRRRPGRYSAIWFEATKVGRLPSVLRRVLRDQPLGDDRHRLRDGAGRLPGLVERRRNRHRGGAAWPSRASSSSRSSRA
jgi:cytochrome c oxidase subunit 2